MALKKPKQAGGNAQVKTLHKSSKQPKGTAPRLPETTDPGAPEPSPKEGAKGWSFNWASDSYGANAAAEANPANEAPNPQVVALPLGEALRSLEDATRLLTDISTLVMNHMTPLLPVKADSALREAANLLQQDVVAQVSEVIGITPVGEAVLMAETRVRRSLNLLATLVNTVRL